MQSLLFAAIILTFTSAYSSTNDYYELAGLLHSDALAATDDKRKAEAIGWAIGCHCLKTDVDTVIKYLGVFFYRNADEKRLRSLAGYVSSGEKQSRIYDNRDSVCSAVCGPNKDIFRKLDEVIERLEQGLYGTSLAAVMIPDIDIWRSANLLITRYVKDAAFEAAQRADALFAKDDMDGCREGKRIFKAIEELERTERRKTEPLN